MRLGSTSIQLLTDEKLEEALLALMNEKARRMTPQCPPMNESPNWEPLISCVAECVEESFAHGYVKATAKEWIYETALKACYGPLILSQLHNLERLA
jgi:hypothetical protein